MQKRWRKWSRKNKYGNHRVKLDGQTFDSKGEADLYLKLKSLEKAKAISNLRCQVVVYLTLAKIKYIVDFAYDENGETIYTEWKGMETPEFLLKKRLWKFYGPGKLAIHYPHKDSELIIAQIVNN